MELNLPGQINTRENPLRVVGIGSGGASTILAIGQSMESGILRGSASLAAVIHTNPDSEDGIKGIARARSLGLELRKTIFPLDRKLFSSEDHFAGELITILERINPDMVGQYGLDDHMPGVVLSEISNARWVNQHPGYVDSNPYHYGGQYMSCTHRVQATALIVARETRRDIYQSQYPVGQEVGLDWDSGRVYKRGKVAIEPRHNVNGEENSLVDEVKEAEWGVQIETIEMIAAGRISFEDPVPGFMQLPEEQALLGLAKEIARASYTKDGRRVRAENVKAKLQGMAMLGGRFNEEHYTYLRKLQGHLKSQKNS